MNTFSSTKKVEPKEAVVLIPQYILSGYAVSYNPSTKTLKVTIKNKGE